MSFFGVLKSMFSKKPKRDLVEVPIEISIHVKHDTDEKPISDKERRKRELFHQQMNDE